jgi:DNA polymerase-3 subunit delta'
VFPLHGHEGAVRALEGALAAGRLSHAYLLTGPAHVGKATLATALAQAVNCIAVVASAEAPAMDFGEPALAPVTSVPCGACRACTRIAAGEHPDVQTLTVDAEAEKGPTTVIGIERVRELIASAHLLPYEGRSRVYVIDPADRMQEAAANALLKVLEEPPPGVLLVLVTANPDGVLPTIRSRCQEIALRPLPEAEVAQVLEAEHGQSPEQAATLARLSRGCIGWAITAAHDPSVPAGLHQRLERIAAVCEGGLAERFAYAEELARRFQRDRAAGRDELALWTRWLRDVLLLQHGQEERILHTAWAGTLRRLASGIAPAALTGWLRATERTLDALERNATPRLALEALMLGAPRPA